MQKKNDDHYLRRDDQLRALLVSAFDSQDAIYQPGSRRELEDLETIDPGHTEWVRGEILKILRDNSRSIEERLSDYTDNDFEEGPQTAWDLWAYIWETVTYGEPWPADLPPANADTFAFLREMPPLPQE